MTQVNQQIRVNQVGYRTLDSKHFVVNGAGGLFDIIDQTNGNIVYTGALAGPFEDVSSGESVFRGDFSELRDKGAYSIRIPVLGTSYQFKVSQDVYNDLTDALLKSFYFQRCGMDLDARHAGVWSHKACHLAHGTVYGNQAEKLPSSGGWHDAGDYGKYTVAAAKAVADLLLAYECFPSVFERTIQIPESGNGVPDILNEVRYELAFFFKMQSPSNGAVFHKVTTKMFPGLEVMPEDDTAELFFSPISVTATAAFAAVMAMAARVYRSFDASFAEVCLDAAERAWNWLAENPESTGFKNPPDIFTGEYGDSVVDDEKYWAAAELFRTTGQVKYHEAFLSALDLAHFPLYELGWADVAGYGTLAYLLAGQNKTNNDIYHWLMSGWLEQADILRTRCESDGYQISLTPDQYIWGSNMVLLNQAMHLIFAAQFSGNAKYVDATLNHLHYLLGQNPLCLSYVTGIGSNAVMNPHHRPSVGDGIIDPIPGMVAGGPNRGLQDEYVKRALEGLPPAKCFVDHKDSYSTNEMTIYWNSPAVFVSAYFDGTLK